MPEPSRLRVVVVHGESHSLWHVVDAAAPEAEQPCVLATCTSPAAAKEAVRAIEERSAP